MQKQSTSVPEEEAIHELMHMSFNWKQIQDWNMFVVQEFTINLITGI